MLPSITAARQIQAELGRSSDRSNNPTCRVCGNSEFPARPRMATRVLLDGTGLSAIVTNLSRSARRGFPGRGPVGDAHPFNLGLGAGRSNARRRPQPKPNSIVAAWLSGREQTQTCSLRAEGDLLAVAVHPRQGEHVAGAKEARTVGKEEEVRVPTGAGPCQCQARGHSP